MKLKHTLTLLSLATCAALSTSAFAQTVTFNGEIVDQACVAIAGTSNVVTLPQRSVSDFPAAGSFTGTTPFNVVLTQCQPLPGEFAVNFSATTPADVITGGYLGNIGVAGVAYELLNGITDAHVDFTPNAQPSSGGFDANAPTTGSVSTGGPHLLSYKVRYIRPTATAVGTGLTSNTAMMTVQYN